MLERGRGSSLAPTRASVFHSKISRGRDTSASQSCSACSTIAVSTNACAGRAHLPLRLNLPVLNIEETHSPVYTTIDGCRSCGSPQLRPVLSLGSTTLADALPTAEQLDEPEINVPLDV